VFGVITDSDQYLYLIPNNLVVF